MLSEKSDLVVCQFSAYEDKQRRSAETKSIKVYNRIDALLGVVSRTIDHVVWNKLYRKELWKETRYPDGRVYEDVDTAFRIINICVKLVFLGDNLYYKRRRPQSVTDTYTKKDIEDWLLAYSHLDSFIDINTPDIFA